MKKLIAIFILFSLFSINHSNAKGWLGIQYLPLNDATIKGLAGEGSLEKDSPKNLLVSGVIKNSPAHLANLLPGDIILEADNKPTKEIKDLLDILDKFSSSETINIKIFRKGTEKILKVRLGKTPADFTYEFVDGSEKYMQFSFPLIFAYKHFIINEKLYRSHTCIPACPAATKAVLSFNTTSRANPSVCIIPSTEIDQRSSVFGSMHPPK